MISHVAEQTVHRIKQGMTRADIGYTPQSMVPLYARLTLIEQNGEPLPPNMGTCSPVFHYLALPCNRDSLPFPFLWTVSVGVTPGGDQNYEVMAKDRRYTHYLGRPLNRFEADKKQLGPAEAVKATHGELSRPAAASSSSSSFSCAASKASKAAADAHQKLKERRAGLVLDSSRPSLAELHSLGDGLGDF
jgi:hypothetical protein